MGRDGYTGLAVLAASLALFAATLGLERHPMVPVSPGFYPRIILGLTAALALLLIVLDVLSRRRAAPAAPQGAGARADYRLVAVAFAIFAAYVLALPWLGFRISTVAFVVAMQATLEQPRGARGWIGAALLAVATAIVAYFVFERYLHVLLPRGRWTDF